MSSIGLYFISCLLTIYSTVPRTLERAFLENSAAPLASLFTREAPLLLSLPDPMRFSDMVTDEQAYGVFERLFRSFPTIEFYPEPGRAPRFHRGGFILSCRWSFLDRSTRDQHPLQVFFHFRPATRPLRPKPLWAIVEIRAERL